VVSLLTAEPVSAQTVSRLTRVLDEQVAQFHHASLGSCEKTLQNNLNYALKTK
jgi:transposase-like protein